MRPVFVYYKNMEITDQFHLNLTSAQYGLLTDIFSSLADLELPPAEDPEFDQLWEKILDADHQIHFNENS